MPFRYRYMKNMELEKSQVSVTEDTTKIYNDVCSIIDGVRTRMATYLNTEVCMTNWYIGKRIKDDVLYNQRAEYGKQILKSLSTRLTERYGNGWGEKQLWHCLRAAETFSEEEIVYATRRQLTWTHLRTIMYIKDPLERQFYTQMCSIEHWGTRTLSEKIDQKLYQRTAISRKPEEVIKHPPCSVYKRVFAYIEKRLQDY